VKILEKFAAVASWVNENVMPEMSRQWTLGRAEAASAIYTGSAFTAYGEGQNSADVPDKEAALSQSAGMEPLLPGKEVEAPEIEQERGGMEM
jgi:hypothetical protein